jgi:hypothetical protein
MGCSLERVALASQQTTTAAPNRAGQFGGGMGDWSAHVHTDEWHG